MRVTLNLASRPFTDIGPAVRRLRIGMAVLAGVCLLLGVGLYLFDRQAGEARAREHSLDGQIARIRAERMNAQAMMRQPDNARLLDQAQVLNQLFDEKAFSWTLAMEAMETVLPAGVQVTSIEPLRDKDGRITVHLRVVGPHDKAVDLVRNLEGSRRFLVPRITGESAETSDIRNQRPGPVSVSDRFSVDMEAVYNPPTPEERALANAKKSSAPANSAPGEHKRVVPALPRHGPQPHAGPPQATNHPAPAATGGQR